MSCFASFQNEKRRKDNDGSVKAAHSEIAVIFVLAMTRVAFSKEVELV